MNAVTAKLAALTVLTACVKIFVPSTVDVDVKIDTEAYVREAQTICSDAFGGATTYAAVGCWTSPTAGLVREDVTLVEAHATEDALTEGIDTVLAFAQRMKGELRRDAIALEVNGQLYLV